jgi:hypothetical protein
VDFPAAPRSIQHEDKDPPAPCRRNPPCHRRLPPPPTTANLAALRARVEADYDQVIVRKRAKLAELERTARHAWKIEEMRAIVEETERDRAFPAAP